MACAITAGLMSDPNAVASDSADAAAPKGALFIIFLIVFMDLLGFGVIIPLLPFYVPDQQHHSLEVGLLFSIYSICQFIAAPILGAISDRAGRRPVLIVSQLGSAVGFVLLGWVSLQSWRMTALGLAIIYLSRIIDGLSGGNISTAQAYISDITTAENRAKGMGVLGAAFGIGFATGPAIGGILGHYNVAYPAFAAAIFSSIAAFLTWWKLPESRVHKPVEAEVWLHPSRFKVVFRRPALVQLLLITFISMCAFVMMEATIALFLSREDTFRWGVDKVGWFFALAGLVIAVVQGGLIGRLTKLFGEWPLAIAGPLLVAVGMTLFSATAYHPLVPMLLLGCAINAGGRSLQHPSMSSLISKNSDRESQGVVFGMYHGLSSLARVFGPIVAGIAYKFHAIGAFVVAGAIVLLAAIWTALVRTTAHHQTDPGRAAGFPIEPAGDAPT
jgi:DHA1 family tetracycline resistance protein-like MFS transporter